MECPHCGHIFFTASASSVEDGGEIVGGVECPECGEFISDEELEAQDDDEPASWDDRYLFGPYSEFSEDTR